MENKRGFEMKQILLASLKYMECISQEKNKDFWRKEIEKEILKQSQT